MLRKAQNLNLQLANRTKNRRKLHSIHGLLRGRVIDGQFEVRGQHYSFSFVPATAALSDRKLVLSGRMVVHPPQLSTRFVDSVDALLVAVQSGVGVSPVRRQLLTGTAQPSQTSTSGQKMEQEKGPETDLQPGLYPLGSPRFDELGRPMVESTGSQSFVGVLYFNLSPLDGSTLGVPLDLSKVQLNLRLATTDDLARDLQNIFSDLVDALYETPVNESAASALIRELNRVFKS
ncbi:MAG: hypothetical protein ND866_13145 [Pyrinomonadaceae bacterium]|nr:hypothetical protein [Pyrinomonadaceae bacterium]